MSAPCLVIKVGGSVVGALAPAWWDDAAAVAATHKVIFVHGWSAPLRALQAGTGRDPVMLVNQHGHRSRFTDARVLDDIRVTSATLRAYIQQQLAQRGVSAVSVDGAAAGLLVADVRLQRWWVGGRLEFLDNLVGPVRDVDTDRIHDLLRDADALVVTPLATSSAHPAVNTDADRAAAMISTAVAASGLVIVTDVPGVQVDGETVAELSHGDLPSLARVVTGGMKKKVNAALAALGGKTRLAVIGRALVSELLSGRAGTRVQRP